MKNGKPINKTTNYPLDIYGITFYYKVDEKGIITIYHSDWEGIEGTGQTMQSAIANMILFVQTHTNKNETIDDKLRKWSKKLRSLKFCLGSLM